jgi:hypothetical protein
MNKSTSAKLSIFVAFVLVFGIYSVKENIYAQTTSYTIPNANTMLNTNTTSTTAGTQETNGGHAAEGQGTVARDQVTLLLEGKGLPKGDFIELYDSTPFKIVNGHFVAKVPCNANGQSQVDLLTGQVLNFKSSEAEFVSQLSAPGKLCLYLVDLTSGSNNTITDVAIKNNSTQDIVFPPTSSVGVGVNAIAPLPQGQE